MDFGTIKKKLNQNIYQDVQMFLGDMSQVFINCKLYNGVESPVGKIGVNVRREYDRLLSTYNFVERFQNSQQVHPSLLFIQSLQSKEEEKNDDLPQQEKAVPKDQNINTKDSVSNLNQSGKPVSDIQNKIAISEAKDVKVEQNTALPMISDMIKMKQEMKDTHIEDVKKVVDEPTISLNVEHDITQNIAAVDTVPQTSLMPSQPKEATAILEESGLEKEDTTVIQIETSIPIPKVIEETSEAVVLKPGVTLEGVNEDQNVLNPNTLILEEIKQKDKKESKIEDSDSADSLMDDVSQSSDMQPKNPIHPA